MKEKHNLKFSLFCITGPSLPYANSVEIYDPTDKTWHSGKRNFKRLTKFSNSKEIMHNFFLCITGPSLPYLLYDSAMAESPDGKGVLIFGGYNQDEKIMENRILELRAGADSWTILNVTLQKGRSRHTVIPIP